MPDFDFLTYVDLQLAELARQDGFHGYYMAIWHPLQEPLVRKELVNDERAGVLMVTGATDLVEVALACQRRERGHRNDIDLEDLRQMEMPEGCRTKVYMRSNSVSHAIDRFVDQFCLPGTRLRVLYWGMHNGHRINGIVVTKDEKGRWTLHA